MVSQLITGRRLVISQLITSRRLAVSQLITSRWLAVSQLITSRRLVFSQLITSRRLVINQLITSRRLVVSQLITSRRLVISQLITSRRLVISQLITSRRLVFSQIITSRRLVISQLINNRWLVVSQLSTTKRVNKRAKTFFSCVRGWHTFWFAPLQHGIQSNESKTRATTRDSKQRKIQHTTKHVWYIHTRDTQTKPSCPARRKAFSLIDSSIIAPLLSATYVRYGGETTRDPNVSFSPFTPKTQNAKRQNENSITYHTYVHV